MSLLLIISVLTVTTEPIIILDQWFIKIGSHIKQVIPAK